MRMIDAKTELSGIYREFLVSAVAQGVLLKSCF